MDLNYFVVVVQMSPSFLSPKHPSPYEILKTLKPTKRQQYRKWKWGSDDGKTWIGRKKTLFVKIENAFSLNRCFSKFQKPEISDPCISQNRFPGPQPEKLHPCRLEPKI